MLQRMMCMVCKKVFTFTDNDQLSLKPKIDHLWLLDKIAVEKEADVKKYFKKLECSQCQANDPFRFQRRSEILTPDVCDVCYQRQKVMPKV